MATNGEMFAFVANFGPMLGELAARVGHLEARIEQLEGGAGVAAPGGADAPPEEETIEFLGQKIDMKAILSSGLPPGGMAGLMDKVKNWKPGQPTPATPTPPATPPATPTKE